jgi:FkbM family methyltransferase
MLFKSHRTPQPPPAGRGEPAAGRPDPAHLFDPRSLQRATREDSEAIVRGLCTSAYVGEGTALCRVLGRYKMYVDTNDTCITPHLLLDGFWEMWVTEVIVDILRPGMVAVDVGANLGYYTLLMGDLVGPKGAIYAFEPNPPIADRLAKSVHLNGLRPHTRVYTDPLDAVNGRVVALTAREGEPGGAHIYGDTAAEGALLMQTRRFDSYPELLRADLVKIDAEGAERDIWRGMTGLFEQRDRPLTILLEFAKARYDAPLSFLEEIEAAGFSLGAATYEGGVHGLSAAEILESSENDLMLVLRR